MSLAVVLFGLVAGAIAREPIGQNLIVILADGYGATLLNNTKPDATFGESQLIVEGLKNSIPGIRHLATNGVQVDYVTPSFPTHTWPQWMSLSTGTFGNPLSGSVIIH